MQCLRWSLLLPGAGFGVINVPHLVPGGVWEGSRAGWRGGNWGKSKVWELCGEWDTWDNEVGNKDLTGGQGSYRLELDGLQEKKGLEQGMQVGE